MKQKILIMGAGKIGTALGKILSHNDENEISFWDVDPDKVPTQKPLSELVAESRVIFFCLPSWETKSAAKSIKKYLQKNSIIISVAKGLEKGTAKTINEIISREIADKKIPVGLLSGPMLADEIMLDMRASAVLALPGKNQFERIEKLFTDPKFSLVYSADVKGIALAGVLKNIYTLSLGLADGLGWGNNFKGYIVYQAIFEMREIVKILGGKKESADSLAALGDLVATGYSEYSRNRTLANELIATGKFNFQSEGMVSMSGLLRLLGKRKKRFPLLFALEKIMLKKQKPEKVLNRLLE